MRSFVVMQAFIVDELNTGILAADTQNLVNWQKTAPDKWAVTVVRRKSPTEFTLNILPCRSKSYPLTIPARNETRTLKLMANRRLVEAQYLPIQT